MPKRDTRVPSYWTREQAQGWGPRIAARLVAGETVDCAGFLLRLAPEEVEHLEERAAIIEHDAGLPRARAEQLALDLVMQARRGVEV
jgi:hypothetical protein